MRALRLADDTHSGSVPLAFETVFDKAGDADVWLVKFNRDRDMSYADLEADYIGYTGFKAFKARNVYGCNTAKVPFYEETPFRPDYFVIRSDTDSASRNRRFGRLALFLQTERVMNTEIRNFL